jgi:hypothetical protein
VRNRRILLQRRAIAPKHHLNRLTRRDDALCRARRIVVLLCLCLLARCGGLVGDPVAEELIGSGECWVLTTGPTCWCACS